MSGGDETYRTAFDSFDREETASQLSFSSSGWSERDKQITRESRALIEGTSSGAAYGAQVSRQSTTSSAASFSSQYLATATGGGEGGGGEDRHQTQTHTHTHNHNHNHNQHQHLQIVAASGPIPLSPPSVSASASAASAASPRHGSASGNTSSRRTGGMRTPSAASVRTAPTVVAPGSPTANLVSSRRTSASAMASRELPSLNSGPAAGGSGAGNGGVSGASPRREGDRRGVASLSPYRARMSPARVPVSEPKTLSTHDQSKGGASPVRRPADAGSFALHESDMYRFNPGDSGSGGGMISRHEAFAQASASAAMRSAEAARGPGSPYRSPIRQVPPSTQSPAHGAGAQLFSPVALQAAVPARVAVELSHLQAEHDFLTSQVSRLQARQQTDAERLEKQSTELGDLRAALAQARRELALKDKLVDENTESFVVLKLEQRLNDCRKERDRALQEADNAVKTLEAAEAEAQSHAQRVNTIAEHLRQAEDALAKQVELTRAARDETDEVSRRGRLALEELRITMSEKVSAAEAKARKKEVDEIEDLRMARLTIRELETKIAAIERGENARVTLLEQRLKEKDDVLRVATKGVDATELVAAREKVASLSEKIILLETAKEIAERDAQEAVSRAQLALQRANTDNAVRIAELLGEKDLLTAQAARARVAEAELAEVRETLARLSDAKLHRDEETKRVAGEGRVRALEREVRELNDRLEAKTATEAQLRSELSMSMSNAAAAAAAAVATAGAATGASTSAISASNTSFGGATGLNLTASGVPAEIFSGSSPTLQLYERAQRDLAQCRRDLESARAEVAAVRATAESATSRATALAEELDDARARLARFEREASSVSVSKSLNRSLADVASSEAMLESRVATLEDELQAARSGRAAAERALAEAKSGVAVLEEEAATLRAHLSREVASVKALMLKQTAESVESHEIVAGRDALARVQTVEAENARLRRQLLASAESTESSAVISRRSNAAGDDEARRAAEEAMKRAELLASENANLRSQLKESRQMQQLQTVPPATTSHTDSRSSDMAPGKDVSTIVPRAMTRFTRETVKLSSEMAGMTVKRTAQVASGGNREVLETRDKLEGIAATCRRRIAEVMDDVEAAADRHQRELVKKAPDFADLVDDHITDVVTLVKSLADTIVALNSLQAATLPARTYQQQQQTTAPPPRKIQPVQQQQPEEEAGLFDGFLKIFE